MKSFIRYIIVALTIIAFSACQEDLIRQEIIGEGKATVSATVDFKPMASALSRSRAAGNVLKDITSLHVLLYDFKTKTLIKSWKIVEYAESDEDRTDADAENGHMAETSTKRATFKMPERIDFGEYYMFAVANIPDLLTNSKYSEAIKTVEGLKEIPLEWDNENMVQNGQMIGCFTDASASISPAQTEETALLLNENATTVHAWLRRAASKVTVAFDGSNLKEGVSIYLKALRIKNIPASCSLGKDNTVSDGKNIIPTGEEVSYSSTSIYDENYPALITKDQPCFPRVKQAGEDGTMSWVLDPDVHSETSPNSLFFYENMQGKGPDKTQLDKDGNGGLDELYGYQSMPNATYIEVDTYYVSTNPDNPGICNITYRFMLGQNITTDYNAKRNCHYKLTLNFNGFADQPDWRIDYVTRMWVTEPKPVDYRGKYFVPDNVTANQGHNFSADNYITVTSFMYENDDWFKRKPQIYKIEYKDAGSAVFKDTPPGWFSLSDPTVEGEGGYIHKYKINYTSPYESVDISDLLANNPQKTRVYDLSTNGGSTSRNTANCYIVDSKGTYQFPLVYGNAITNGSDNKESYEYKRWNTGPNILKNFKNYKDKSIESPYILEDITKANGGNRPTGFKPSLLWQDEPNLITNIGYSPEACGGIGGITFNIGNIKEGNAVIALKDNNNEIMWSWHIWVTAFDLSRTITLSNFENIKFEIMPVNVGWCSGGVPVRYYDRHECEVRFTQLISGEGQKGVSQIVKIIQEPHIAVPMGNNPYYQWGRKDPFIAGGNANEETKAWYDASNNQVRDSYPKLMYSTDNERVPTRDATAALIRNPDRWQNGPRIKNDNPNITGDFRPKDNIYHNLWDNSCWDGNNLDKIIKTIYDPCPAGYHVSSRHIFTGFTQSGENIADSREVIEKYMYAAIADNMMPLDHRTSEETEDQIKEWYRDNIFEFYTDITKLQSIGFPENGYRDWDDNGNVLKFKEEGHVWHAQSNPWDAAEVIAGNDYRYNAFHFEYSKLGDLRIWPYMNYYATDGFPVRPSRRLPME